MSLIVTVMVNSGLSSCRVILISITTILKRRGCLTVPRLTLMSLIKMMLVMVSVAAISKTFGLLRFLLRLSFLAKRRLLPHLLTLWVCKLLMLICILTKNVITSCSVTMMLFLHLEVKPLMTLTTVLYLSCALISGDSAKKFKIAEGQWYRYAPSYVSPAYHLLEGFPFIQEPPSGDLQERVLIRHHDYDQCFQSVQLLQWNSQVKFNVTVYRNLPTTRDSIMTS